MKRAVVILSIILTATATYNAGQRRPKGKPGTVSTASESDRKAWSKMRERFTKYSDFLSGHIWALIHVYESRSEMEQSLKLFESLSMAFASDDPASMKKFDGPGGFKSQLSQTLNSRDGTVSGFAAIVLAIIGDPKYAPKIATLLTRDSHLPPDKYPPITVRGRAAVALGMLGAKQYVTQIANLLGSKNGYDRSGSAMALGYLDATEHAKAVADLLTVEDFGSNDDTSPIHSLFEMGVAGNYKKEMASVLDDEMTGEKAIAAAYALVHLGAKEHARDIAKLLESEFKSGEGAKALALLGVEEYNSKILVLLDDQNSFNREDAALALGVLNAREHKAAIARLLKAEEWWVRMGAAQALVLMEATEYASEVLPAIAEQKAGDYLDAEDFHTLVTDESRQLNTRFLVLLARMKASSTRP